MQCLEHHLKLWEEGDLEGLLQEGHTIQQCLLSCPQTPSIEQQRACSYAKLIMEGKVWAALYLLSGGPPMALDEEVEVKGVVLSVRNVLKQKHPEAKPINPTAVVTTNHMPQELDPVIFDEITGPLIRSTALRTEGSASPSGMTLRGGDAYATLSIRLHQNLVMSSSACEVHCPLLLPAD